MTKKEGFHHGRIDAQLSRPGDLGFLLVEFMREGDEEQHFEMDLDEARAFRDWLNAVLPAEPSCTHGYEIVPTMGPAICANCGKELK